MEKFLDFTVIADNFTYFMFGRFPNGPLGGLGLTIYLAVVSCILSFFGGLILGSPVTAGLPCRPPCSSTWCGGCRS